MDLSAQIPLFPEELIAETGNNVPFESWEKVLTEVSEPPLHNLADLTCFRLIWHPSLDYPVVIRAWRYRGHAWIRYCSPGGFQSGVGAVSPFDHTYPVELGDWEKLVSGAKDPEIWRPLTELQIAYGQSILDGESWLIEKVVGGSYACSHISQPRLNDEVTEERRDYTPIAKWGDSLVSLLPEETRVRERFGVGTMPSYLPREPVENGVPDPFAPPN